MHPLFFFGAHETIVLALNTFKFNLKIKFSFVKKAFRFYLSTYVYMKKNTIFQIINLDNFLWILENILGLNNLVENSNILFWEEFKF